jgi:uncharacterized protein DUF4426
MRIGNTAIFACLFIPLILLSACEQQTGSSQSNVDRIVFDANVHDMDFGNYVIHVNAITTDQLPTEIARGYKISRSKNRAMINITVREKQANQQIPVTATVNVAAKNLSNQLKNVKIREIKDSDPIAIYYIGELAVSNEEIIVFDVDVTPTGTSEALLLSYRQQFFTE